MGSGAGRGRDKPRQCRPRPSPPRISYGPTRFRQPTTSRVTKLYRMTRHFHEKAGPCQAVFLGRAIRTADCRPTGGTVSLQSFLLRKVFLFGQRYSRSPTSGRRTMLPSRILKSPTRPTSIRTLGGASCSGASWVFSIGNGCCRLGAELDIAVSSDFVPSACRSHPNSAICFESCQAAFFPAARRF